MRVEQGRLADPRVAAHHQRAATAGAQVAEQLVEFRQLRSG
jgi:hypothetical protein